MAKNFMSLLAGLLFGLGLAISQMNNPEKVLAFLDIFGNWDPSLALVLLAAVAVSHVGFRLTMRRPRPVLGKVFQLPTGQDIDRRLIGGSAIFGIGWGLAGYCPGPAMATLSIGGWEPLLFIATMLAGSLAYKTLDNVSYQPV